MRERDETQQLLRDLKPSTASVAAAAPSNHHADDSAMDIETPVTSSSSGHNDEVGVSEEVVGELNAVCKTLSGTRKGRKVSDQLLSKEDMSTLHEISSFSPHKTGSILSLALTHDENTGNSIVATGGSDKSIVVSDVSTSKVICKVSGHKASVTKVTFGNHTLFSASEDKTVKVRSAWFAVTAVVALLTPPPLSSSVVVRCGVQMAMAIILKNSLMLSMKYQWVLLFILLLIML
jgi:WD40 repeat protein